MNAGVTLIELMVAVTTAAVIALVSVQLFRVALMTYQVTARQTLTLSSFRAALAGNGKNRGILESARLAASMQSLNAGTPVFVSTSAATATYSVTAAGLTSDASGTSVLLAGSVSTMTVSYYNLDASGLIMASTSAASAQMVTALVTIQGTGAQKTYRSYAGARLRNHP